MLLLMPFERPGIELPARSETLPNYAEVRDALEFDSLTESQFCSLWRKAAAQALSQGNLVTVKLLLALFDKAQVRTTHLGQLIRHECSGRLGLIEGAFDHAGYHFREQFGFAQKLDDPLEIGLTYLHLARINLYSFKLDSVRDLLQEAARWAELANDPALKVKTLNRQAELAAYLHRNDESIALAHRALALARRHQLTLEEAFALNWLGINFVHRRQWEAAQQALQAALHLRQGAHDVIGRAETLANLGRLYLKWGNYKMAKAATDSGLAIVEQLRHRPGTAQLFYQKAQLLYRTGEKPEALKWAKRAVELRLELEEPTKLAEAFSLLGQIYADLNESGYALLCHLRVWELFPSDATNPQWIELLTGVGDYLLRLPSGQATESAAGYWQEALQSYRAAIEIIEHNSELYYLAPLLGKMAWALLKLEGLAGLPEAMRCFRLQLGLLGDIESPFFELVDAISQRAQAIMGLQICASLLRRE